MPRQESQRESVEGRGETQRLLRSWQESGDRTALERLLQSEIAELKRRIAHRFRNRLDVLASPSDIAQDAVHGVLRAEPLPRFHSPNGFRTYLWRAAERRLIDRLRRLPRPERLEERSDTTIERVLATRPASGIERSDLRREVLTVLALLPEDSRQILGWSLLEERDNAEIAGLLGIPPDAARMRVVRAKRQLRHKLERWRALIEG